MDKTKTTVYQVGSELQQFKGSQPGILWDYNNGMSTLLYLLNDELIQNFKLGGHYDFACKKIDNVLFICVKHCDRWMSAPYTPHLSPEFVSENFESPTGMPLTILIVNVASGIIESTDFLVLGNIFSNTFNQICEELIKDDFDIINYQNTIQTTYEAYKTDFELSCQATFKYSID